MKTVLITPFFVLGFIAELFVVGHAQTTSIKKCDSTIKGGQYRLISEDRTRDGTGLLIFIVVDSKRINESDLKKVASRIKAEYCNEPNLQAVIADKRKFADPIVLFEFTDSKGRIVKMRGFYSFDRKAGTENLEFSRKRGNPTEEVKVTL